MLQYSDPIKHSILSTQPVLTTMGINSVILKQERTVKALLQETMVFSMGDSNMGQQINIAKSVRHTVLSVLQVMRDAEKKKGKVLPFTHMEVSTVMNVLVVNVYYHGTIKQ